MQAIPFLFMAGGALMQVAGARRQAGFDSSVAQQNIILSQQKATLDKRARLRAAHFERGEAVAKFAKAGVDVNFGAPLEVLGSIAEEASYDTRIIDYEAAIAVAGHRNEITASKVRRDTATASGIMKAGGYAFGGYNAQFGEAPEIDDS